ncbi:DUF302 domain-containing protein [bacterium]|nr:DUF302 domain-containing protein [bacterium]
MTKPVITFVLGLVLGVLACGVIMSVGGADMMLLEDKSRLNHAETVQAVKDAALAAGWKVPAVHEIHDSVAKGGFDVLPVTVIELCSVSLAGRILGDTDGRRVAPMMPCRVAIYETAAGDVIVSRMNSGLMSKVFGGIVEDMMSEAAAANEAMFSSLF